MANNFKELIVWQKSKELTKLVYELCRKLPREEIYGLCSQMQRAAVSAPPNIAEGYRRKGSKEFLQFLSIASGSCAELETQLILTEEIYGFDTKDLQENAKEILKMLMTSLMSKVNANSK